MNVLDVIRNRQSTRGPFDPQRPIPEDQLRQVIEAARWAPTAHNMQNFELVVVDDRQTLEGLSKLRGEISQTFLDENYALLSFSDDELRKRKVGLLGTNFPASWRTPGVHPHVDAEHAHSVLGAPLRMCAALMVVVYDPHKRAPASEHDALGMMSLGCVMENMWLVASSLGIGFQIQSSLGSEKVEAEVRALLGVPDTLRIAFAIRLGYPLANEMYTRVRRDARDFTHRNRYGSPTPPVEHHAAESETAQSKADSALAGRVKDELSWEPSLEQAGLDVGVRNGVVTLSGTVDSWAVRMRAQDVAHQVEGVLDVANDVQVKPLGAAAETTDAHLASAVRRMLEWDALVPHEQVRTTITDGVVTLEGTVDSPRQREDVERCIRNLVGVTQVRNQLEVKVPGVAKGIVRYAVEGALRQMGARAQHVHARIAAEAVVLTGTVPSWNDWRAVEAEVKTAAGTLRVDNQLRIEGEGAPADAPH